MAGGFASGRLAIAICGRCSVKYPYQALRVDGNNPGLRVCCECRDPLDPYRLPPRQPENIVMQYPRPDTSLADIPPYVLDENGEPIIIGFEEYIQP